MTSRPGFPRRGRPGLSRRRRSRRHAMPPGPRRGPRRRCVRRRGTIVADRPRPSRPELIVGDEDAIAAPSSAATSSRDEVMRRGWCTGVAPRATSAPSSPSRVSSRRVTSRGPTSHRCHRAALGRGTVERDDEEMVVVFGGGRLAGLRRVVARPAARHGERGFDRATRSPIPERRRPRERTGSLARCRRCSQRRCRPRREIFLAGDLNLRCVDRGDSVTCPARAPHPSKGDVHLPARCRSAGRSR